MGVNSPEPTLMVWQEVEKLAVKKWSPIQSRQSRQRGLKAKKKFLWLFFLSEIGSLKDKDYLNGSKWNLDYCFDIVKLPLNAFQRIDKIAKIAPSLAAMG